MKPAPVTDFLLHDLVMSAAAEGAVRTAVAAAVTLNERILLPGRMRSSRVTAAAERPCVPPFSSS